MRFWKTKKFSTCVVPVSRITLPYSYVMDKKEEKKIDIVDECWSTWPLRRRSKGHTTPWAFLQTVSSMASGTINGNPVGPDSSPLSDTDRNSFLKDNVRDTIAQCRHVYH